VDDRVHAELLCPRAEVHVRHPSPARDLAFVGDPQQPPGVVPEPPAPASACTHPLWHIPADKASAAPPDGRFRANIPGHGRGYRIPGGRDAKGDRITATRTS